MIKSEIILPLSDIPCGMEFHPDQGVNLPIGGKMFWTFQFDVINTKTEQKVKTKQPIIAQYFSFQHRGIKFGLNQGLAVSYQ